MSNKFRKKNKKRLFIAVKPSSDYIESINNFIEFNQKTDLKWIQQENYHITCLYLGDINDDRIVFVKKIVAEVLKGFSSFEMEAERFTFTPAVKPRMIWLRFKRNKEFVRLNFKLSKRLLNSAPEKPARPHITLSRFKYAPKKHLLYSKLPEEKMKIEELFLFQSELLAEGAKYTELARWRLK